MISADILSTAGMSESERLSQSDDGYHMLTSRFSDTMAFISSNRQALTPILTVSKAVSRSSNAAFSSTARGFSESANGWSTHAIEFTRVLTTSIDFSKTKLRASGKFISTNEFTPSGRFHMSEITMFSDRPRSSNRFVHSQVFQMTGKERKFSFSERLKATKVFQGQSLKFRNSNSFVPTRVNSRSAMLSMTGILQSDWLNESAEMRETDFNGTNDFNYAETVVFNQTLFDDSNLSYFSAHATETLPFSASQTFTGTKFDFLFGTTLFVMTTEFEATNDFIPTAGLNTSVEYSDSATFPGLSPEVVAAVTATVTGTAVAGSAGFVGVRKFCKTPRVDDMNVDFADGNFVGNKGNVEMSKTPGKAGNQGAGFLTEEEEEEEELPELELDSEAHLSVKESVCVVADDCVPKNTKRSRSSRRRRRINGDEEMDGHVDVASENDNEGGEIPFEIPELGSDPEPEGSESEQAMGTFANLQCSVALWK
jgi:hypothetical protein